MNDGQQTLRLTPLWLVIGWSLVLAVVYLSLSHSPPDVGLGIEHVDKIGHGLAYFILMGWFVQIYAAQGKRVAFAVGFVAMGVGLEIIQGMGGVRYFEYADMIANTLGVVVAFVFSGTSFQYLLSRFEQHIM